MLLAIEHFEVKQNTQKVPGRQCNATTAELKVSGEKAAIQL